MKYRQARKVQRAIAKALGRLLGGSEVYPCGCCDSLRVDVKKKVSSIEIDSDDDYKIHKVVVVRAFMQQEARGRRKLAPNDAAPIRTASKLDRQLKELALGFRVTTKPRRYRSSSRNELAPGGVLCRFGEGFGLPRSRQQDPERAGS
jgi:hypothetical protein